ncbi:hypothetical protein G9A89_013522 [Geosiphon pyriformis]|nr:hypothetical protein G9A89_013522 [Geosiphon pyriformis]
MPLTETYMALESTFNWAKETEQEIFEESRGWKKVRYSTPKPPYIPLKCKDCKKKLSSMGVCISPKEEYETRTCYFYKACHREQFESPKRKKVRRETPFDAAYNSALNKLYHYFHDAEMIFDLAMALINRATQEDVHQIKEAEYIEYTIELARFNYVNKIETYHQIASHTYSTQEAQIQQLEQINIQLCEECIMLYNDK